MNKTAHLLFLVFAWACCAEAAGPRQIVPDFPGSWDRTESFLHADGKALKRWLFKTRASARDVVGFYRKELMARGWSEAEYTETELLAAMLSVEPERVAVLRLADVCAHVVAVPAEGENCLMGIVSMMFERPMKGGGMGSFGVGVSLYPSGTVMARMTQTLAGGMVLFEQAKAPDSPALVLPHVSAMLAGSGWADDRNAADIRGLIGFEDGMRVFVKGGDKLAVSAAPLDHVNWLYFFVKYENINFERAAELAQKAGIEPREAPQALPFAPACCCKPPGGWQNMIK